MDRSVFQDACFQPAPDQTDQARITDSMLDKPENPVVTETPEEVLDRKSTRLNSRHTEIYTLSLHDALPISCFQPAPDQTDQARITDSMLDKPENPVVTETPEEV